MKKIIEFIKRNSQYIIYLAVAFFSIVLSFIIFESSTFHFNFTNFQLFDYPLNSVFWGGLLIVSLCYLFCISVFSNIFITSVLFLSVFVGLGLANTEKITSTGNPIFWTDIVMGIHPIEMFSLIDMRRYMWAGIFGLLLLLALGFFQFFIWNKKYKLTKDRLSIKKSLWIRLATAIVSLGILLTFLYLPDSPFSRTILRKDNENYKEWNMRYNYRTNGSVYSLIRNIHKVATREPEGYSEEKIQQIVNKYTHRAAAINLTRQGTGKNRKVIFLLSETFSDPERMKGFELDGNPVPNIQRLKKENLSGNIVVPGVGGGTSDTEWTILSSLNMRMLAGDINSPYTDFYFEQNNPQTILDLLDEKKEQTVAVHATPPIYYRNGDVYHNIGVRKYFSTENIKDFKPISKEKTFVSDKSFFNVVMEKISQPNNKVVIGQSMQNHQPFNFEYFKDHRFSADGKVSNEALKQVRNYAQGLSITDKEVMNFLDKLEQAKDDITLVFYGDHVPVAYNPFAKDNDYPTMHSGDYFIYNNHNYTNKKPLEAETGDTHSSSFLANKLLWNLDMKVSPFYAMTTHVEKTLPIVSKDYLGTIDESLAEKELTSVEQEALNDYQMITHDILNGKQYSLNQDFFKVQD